MEDTKIQQQAETKPGIIYPQDYTLKSLASKFGVETLTPEITTVLTQFLKSAV